MPDSEIAQLDPQTVERIAAGEVVERPASVVKELVENSIDADASRVSVAVEAGGTEGIRVSDDGVGMAEDALRTAVEKHTTSKISDIDDLESGVATLGFRGEALHAIGAVSRLAISSRPRGADVGTELTVEGGDVTDVSPAGCPEGTTVDVRDLFYNVPARRKYLKQESTEFAHVNTVVTSYALANPEVAVSLEHDGRETFATTGTGDLIETVMAVYGRAVAESMRQVEGAELPDGPLDGVSGLVSHPETNRSTREYLSTFVNGRYVTANTVRDAVVDAYDTQLAPDRYPFAVLFLEVDPGTVDVNVHPRKLEVRFADEAGVRKQVGTAIESALLRDGLIRSSAPRGKSAPDQTEIHPESGNDAESGDGTTQSTEKMETPSSDQSSASTLTQEQSVESESSQGVSTENSISTTEPLSSSESRASEPSEHTTRAQATDSTAKGITESDISSAESEPSKTSTEQVTGEGKFRGNSTQERLGDGEVDVAFETLPSMRVLGQLHDTYVVAETDDGLVLIDQHAADERINYERLKDRFDGETTTQALAEPVSLALTARESELFSAHSEALSRLGFHADLVDDRTLEVRTVPAMIADAAGPEMIRDVLSEFVSGQDRAAETVEAAVDELLGDLACYPSVTGNTSLTDGSVIDLLSALDECENPYACPHGRPVVVELDSEELVARFERDYPGHS
jgi:DNA mismatch repair protein MutL